MGNWRIRYNYRDFVVYNGSTLVYEGPDPLKAMQMYERGCTQARRDAELAARIELARLNTK